jgi:hypothetical protein
MFPVGGKPRIPPSREQVQHLSPVIAAEIRKISTPAKVTRKVAASSH